MNALHPTSVLMKAERLARAEARRQREAHRHVRQRLWMRISAKARRARLWRDGRCTACACRMPARRAHYWLCRDCERDHSARQAAYRARRQAA